MGLERRPTIAWCAYNVVCHERFNGCSGQKSRSIKLLDFCPQQPLKRSLYTVYIIVYSAVVYEHTAHRCNSCVVRSPLPQLHTFRLVRPEHLGKVEVKCLFRSLTLSLLSWLQLTTVVGSEKSNACTTLSYYLQIYSVDCFC